MTNPVIPAEAVEAAAKASWEKANSDPWISGDTDDPRWADRRVYLDDAKVMLEAAAPHMVKAAYDLGLQHGANQPTNPYMLNNEGEK